MYSKQIKMAQIRSSFFVLRNMVTKYIVEGYDDYLELTKQLAEKKIQFFILFKGSLDNSGKSWCSDCVQAGPLIEEVIKTLPDSIHLVTVYVGDKIFWKDANCPFRKDKKARVTILPTIIRWDGQHRIEGHDFKNKDIIKMAFEDDS